MFRLFFRGHDDYPLGPLPSNQHEPWDDDERDYGYDEPDEDDDALPTT